MSWLTLSALFIFHVVLVVLAKDVILVLLAKDEDPYTLVNELMTQMLKSNFSFWSI